MVNFKKLRASATKPKVINPIEIFRRLPKPVGINDLYTSQADVLQSWHERRSDRDVVVKLHTGGGKTLVGLLIAQSALNETGEPVLYLSPTTQLVKQTLEKAESYGIAAVPYTLGTPLDDDFLNGKAIMVGTYAALFNGKSKFGVRGSINPPVKVSAIILDDAHAAFSVVRDAFTISISKQSNNDLYERLAGVFRLSFKDTDRIGSFDDVIAGSDYTVLDVPYWAWREKLDAVRALLKEDTSNYSLTWPLIRDNLHLCHALISRATFTITPVLPFVNALPTFYESPRRIYMSATIADDSEIVRTFDASIESVNKSLTSRSLAGVSERMILVPELMPFTFDVHDISSKLLKRTAKQRKGAIVLVPSAKTAEKWTDVAKLPKDSSEVDKLVSDLQAGNTFGPIVFANRFDGIDLPGDSCRLLIMEGLPIGSSDYELYKASALYGGTAIARMLAQRIEQGIGRGARGAGDHCVVLLLGRSLAAWIAKEANGKYLTSATRAQLEMGQVISKSVSSTQDLADTIAKSYNRDREWIEFHADTLADLVDEATSPQERFKLASAERKAVNLWQDGSFEKAITKLEKASEAHVADPQAKGWLLQLAACIADSWNHGERAEELQRQAFANNRNLLRPKTLPPYRPLPNPDAQANTIVAHICEYNPKWGFLRAFEEAVSSLHSKASANQFENALEELGRMIGLSAERHDEHGEGPDVLWLLPSKVGLIIEAKSRKKDTKAFKKDDHGQLLVAEEWFSKHYSGYKAIRVSVHSHAKATKAASAHGSYALTFEKLALLISDARAVLSNLCESQLKGEGLVLECAALLNKSNIREDRLVKTYLQPFIE